MTNRNCCASARPISAVPIRIVATAVSVKQPGARKAASAADIPRVALGMLPELEEDKHG
jgi:hypothetical protein